MNYLFSPPDEKKMLSPSDSVLLRRIEDCYTIQLSNPMYSHTEMRNYLMNKYNLDRNQAIRIMNMTKIALGDVASASKTWIKRKIEFLLERAYIAQNAGDMARAKALTRIAEAYGKTFGTANEDADNLDVKSQIKIDKVLITVNPADIGIKVSDAEKKRVDKLLKKYNQDEEIIDISEDDVENVTNE